LSRHTHTHTLDASFKICRRNAQYSFILAKVQISPNAQVEFFHVFRDFERKKNKRAIEKEKDG
jgi:hypothetical protein